jgi:hypothetical protein
MKRFALSLLFLALSLPLFAQTTTTVHLGGGVCNTSPAGAFFCVAISVTGIGTPGYTYASFFVEPRNGTFTLGSFEIGDDYTGGTVLLEGNNITNTIGSFTGTDREASGVGIADGYVIGTVVDPVRNKTATVNVTMTQAKLCAGRYGCTKPVPREVGGTVVITSQ